MAAAVVAVPALLQGTPVLLQASSPGVPQTGHLNITGVALTGGVTGYSSTLTGIAYGGDFRSVSTSGRGILGNASATSGATYGGLFQAASTGGRGVAGIASATIGTTYGGFFSSLSSQGRGVYGQATETTGVNYGVYGKTASPNGYGVFSDGNMSATGVISGDGSGLTALSASAISSGALNDARLSTNVPFKNGNNVFTGPNQFAEGTTYVGSRNTPLGVGEIFGIGSNSTGFAGMYVTSGSGGTPYYAYSNGTHSAYTSIDAAGSFRIFNGSSTSAIISAAGLIGMGVSVPNTKLDIFLDDATTKGALHVVNGSVLPFGTNRSAIYAETKAAGQVEGSMIFAESTSSSAVGLEAYAKGTSTVYGVYASATGGTTNYAGYFGGTIFANSASSGVKSFLIDHPMDPANKFLEHSSVESDERKNIYDGVVRTDSRGYATILLPAWFQALNEDFRYQLTIVDEGDNAAFAQAKVVQKIADNRFRIRSSTPNTEVSWQVTGRRHDQTSEYTPMKVERFKNENERGKYLLPEAFGKDKTFGMAYGATAQSQTKQVGADRHAKK